MYSVTANLLIENDVSDALVLLREEELGVSQAEVAAKIGMNHKSYAALEAGKTLPGMATIKKICKAYGLECEITIKRSVPR